jgi:transposase-like protein
MQKEEKIKKRKSAEEKEKILLQIGKLGAVAGCRKYQISAPTYYDWLNKYNSGGLEALRGNKRKEASELEIKRLQKEMHLLKELLVEKDLQIKMQQEVIKKKNSEWKQKKM